MKAIQQLVFGTIAAVASVSAWMFYQEDDAIAYELITPAQVGELRSQEYNILDIRTPAEQELGTLTPDTFRINSTASSVESELASLNTERGYIIYNRNGKELGELLALFERLGFSDIKILEGGYQAWVAYTGR